MWNRILDCQFQRETGKKRAKWKMMFLSTSCTSGTQQAISFNHPPSYWRGNSAVSQGPSLLSGQAACKPKSTIPEPERIATMPHGFCTCPDFPQKTFIPQTKHWTINCITDFSKLWPDKHLFLPHLVVRCLCWISNGSMFSGSSESQLLFTAITLAPWLVQQ